MTVSFTKLSTLAECAKRFYYSYVMELEAPPEEKTFLNAGSAGHKGLEVLYKTGDLDAALAAVEATWDDLKATPQTLGKGRNVYTLNCGWVQAALKNYHADRFGVEDYEVLETEIEFEVDLDLGEPLRGRIDQIIRRDKTTKVLDFKWTTQPVTEWWAFQRQNFPMSFQLKLYILAAEKIEKLVGVTIQGAEVLAIHMGAYVAEGDPKKTQHRSVLFDTMEEWNRPATEESVQWAKDVMQEMEWRRETGVYAMNTKNMYGCPMCDFYLLCSSTPRTREGLIQSYGRKVEHGN